MKQNIPVFSLFPVDVCIPERTAALYHEMVKQCWPRETYPVLPWSMECLVGTIWRNVHDGSQADVVDMREDRFANPTLSIQCADSSVLWTLGFWLGECRWTRYVIEHWVRVDQLSTEDQFPWFRFRVKWINMQIIQHAQQREERIRVGDKVNRRVWEQALAHDQRQMTKAKTQFHMFAEQAGLSLSPEIFDEWESKECT